jgi:hypothetical protein
LLQPARRKIALLVCRAHLFIVAEGKRERLARPHPGQEVFHLPSRLRPQPPREGARPRLRSVVSFQRV